MHLMSKCMKPEHFLFLVLLASACGSVPIKIHYTLNNEVAADAPGALLPMCPMSLGIEPVDVSPPYDVSKIIFRPDSLEVRFYTQSRWVSPPEDMFAVLIARRIEALHLFSAVDHSINVSGPHLSLLVKLYAVEEVDKGRNWQGHLAMSLELRDEMGGELLWRHSFDRKEDSPKNEVKSVVAVISRIYNEEMKKAEDSLKSFLISSGRCRPADSAQSRIPSFASPADAADSDDEQAASDTKSDAADAEKVAQ